MATATTAAAPRATATAGSGVGLLLLFAFELLLVAYTASFGAWTFTAMAVGAAALLALGWWQTRQDRPVHALVLAGLAAFTLWRAAAQTTGPSVPLGLAASYLVPAGFALAAAAGRAGPRAAVAGLALVSVARSFFAVWYLLGGNATLVVANLLGAAGAWLWTASLLRGARASPR